MHIGIADLLERCLLVPHKSAHSHAERLGHLRRRDALLAQAHGDEASSCDYRDRYRAMATSLGFEGHLKWAEAMP